MKADVILQISGREKLFRAVWAGTLSFYLWEMESQQMSVDSSFLIKDNSIKKKMFQI